MAAALGSWGSPYDAAGGWRKARRVAAGVRPVFRQDRDVLSKNPVTRPRTWRAQPGRRVIREALLFGYFDAKLVPWDLLGKQEKVTRPPAGGRKPAAGEPGRRIATTKHRGSGSRLSPGRQIDTFPRAPAPHPSPLPGGEREQSGAPLKGHANQNARPAHTGRAPQPSTSKPRVTARGTPNAPAPPPPRWWRQPQTSLPGSAAPTDSPTAAGSPASAAARHRPDRSPRCPADPAPCH